MGDTSSKRITDMTPTRVPTASDCCRRGAKGEGSKKELEDKSKGAGEGRGQFAGHGASLRFAGGLAEDAAPNSPR